MALRSAQMELELPIFGFRLINFCKIDVVKYFFRIEEKILEVKNRRELLTREYTSSNPFVHTVFRLNYSKPLKAEIKRAFLTIALD